MMPYLICLGLVFCGFQIGKLWSAYKIAKNPQAFLNILAEHRPDLIDRRDRE
jgi:hypothetical protein